MLRQIKNELHCFFQTLGSAFFSGTLLKSWPILRNYALGLKHHRWTYRMPSSGHSRIEARKCVQDKQELLLNCSLFYQQPMASHLHLLLFAFAINWSDVKCTALENTLNLVVLTTCELGWCPAENTKGYTEIGGGCWKLQSCSIYQIFPMAQHFRSITELHFDTEHLWLAA